MDDRLAKPDGLEKQKRRLSSFIDATQAAREQSELCRDFYCGYQWTDDEVSALKKRGQAPVVINRVKAKTNGYKGLLMKREADIKAFPRTKREDKAAEAMTDALKYVAESVNLKEIRADVGEEIYVEGYGGAIVRVEGEEGDVRIVVEQIPFDRIIFSPHSRKRDFSDSRYKGYFEWMDAEEAEEKFPGVDFEGMTSNDGAEADTFRDRPDWIDSKTKRVKIVHLYYKERGAWMECIYTGDRFLMEPRPSALLDDKGKPCCPIELAHAYIDRKNNRFGEVQAFIDLQREINKRRSKALHYNSARQTYGTRGAIGSDEELTKNKQELAKPDGHVEVNGEFGVNFGVIPTDDAQDRQFLYYGDAKAELDSVSYNAQLSGERQQGDISGKAIRSLQEAGTVELTPIMESVNGFETRIYRQIFARIRQFWTEEKWIRVTDDQDKLRYVGLNAQVTVADKAEEMMRDESLTIEERRQAAALHQYAMQDQAFGQQVIEVRNRPAELDIDIILDYAQHNVNAQQEEFELLVEMARGGIISDPKILLEASSLRNKKKLIEMVEGAEQQRTQQAGDLAALEAQDKQADIAQKSASAVKTGEEAKQKQIENFMLINTPQQVTSVAV